MGSNEHSANSLADTTKLVTKLPVYVGDLRKTLGEKRTEPVDVVLPTTVVIQSRTTSDPVVGQVLIESIERGVSVTGMVKFGWEADCRRCLEMVERTQEVDIDEIFQLEAPEDSGLIDFDGQQIDLLPVVRDAVVLSLPLAPLCGPACEGPDPSRYPAEIEGERALVDNGPDPRWAALDGLTFSED